MITGANSGIGLEATVQLAARGCEVVMCCRSVEKAEKARQDALKRSKADESKIHVVQLDLADLDNIGSFRSRYDAVGSLSNRPIDMLILNAGIMAPNKRTLTKQGIEAQMGTNVVGHFKFLAVMIDLCKQAQSCRVVAVSSFAHLMVKAIDFNDFNREKTYSKWHVYEESKLGNILLIRKLNRLLAEKGVKNIVAVGCHPGYSNTNLQDGTVFQPLNALFAQNARKGAEPTVLAATDPNGKADDYAGPSGFRELWGNAKWGCKVNGYAKKPELQDKLWAKCEELTNCNLASLI